MLIVLTYKTITTERDKNQHLFTTFTGTKISGGPKKHTMCNANFCTFTQKYLIILWYQFFFPLLIIVINTAKKEKNNKKYALQHMLIKMSTAKLFKVCVFFCFVFLSFLLDLHGHCSKMCCVSPDRKKRNVFF